MDCRCEWYYSVTNRIKLKFHIFSFICSKTAEIGIFWQFSPYICYIKTISAFIKARVFQITYGGIGMRELSVYFCEKCGYYAYYQLPKNAICPNCEIPMIQLDIEYSRFVELDYKERDQLIIAKIIKSSPTLVHRISSPEKLYCQRKLVGILTQQLADQEKEIEKLNTTIEWMHSTIWTELQTKQKLKEEIRQLKELLKHNQ